VVADERDVDEVTRATEQFKEAGVQCPVYIMPLGGRSEEYELNTDRVAKLAMARGWRYTPEAPHRIVRQRMGDMMILQINLENQDFKGD
jgi:hypothetical protein